jgi:hypothetical protein
MKEKREKKRSKTAKYKENLGMGVYVKDNQKMK